MRNFFYLIFLATLFVACNQSLKFTINGNIEGLPDGIVYLKQRIGGEVLTLDSARSVGGKFVLKGVVAVPDMYTIVLGERKQIPVLLENKAIKVTGKADDLRNVSITGSASQDEMKALEAKGAEVNARMKELYAKHEYTLVDFWASWCGPCRKENPNVVAVWKEFNTKGFHVIGVSCDSDKDKWLKAIASDKLTWSHVSDLKGWGNAAAKLYGVNSIPANLLLDKTGKIVAKNLREEKLRDRVQELLK